MYARTCSGPRQILRSVLPQGECEEVGGPRESERRAAEDATGENRAICHWFAVVGGALRMPMYANEGKGRRITICCGGISNQTWEKTLRRFPKTLLTNMVTTGQLKDRSFIYLDRNPYAFMDILNIYRSACSDDKVVVAEDPTHIAPDVWMTELTYFRMQHANIAKIDKMLLRFKEEEGDNTALLPKGKWRQTLYLMLEEPTSCLAARIYSGVSFSLIFISIFLVIIETVPSIENDPKSQQIINDLDFAISVLMTVEWFVRWARLRPSPPMCPATAPFAELLRDDDHDSPTTCQILFFLYIIISLKHTS